MQMTDIVNRRKMRHAHMVNINKQIMLEGMRADYDKVDAISRKAMEIVLLNPTITAPEALEMGLINTVVPLDQLEAETVGWCREMLAMSPFALRMLKASFNADEDGLAGIQQLAHDANLLFYMSEEAAEGRQAYLEKRRPDFSKFPRRA